MVSTGVLRVPNDRQVEMLLRGRIVTLESPDCKAQRSVSLAQSWIQLDRLLSRIESGCEAFRRWKSAPQSESQVVICYAGVRSCIVRVLLDGLQKAHKCFGKLFLVPGAPAPMPATTQIRFVSEAASRSRLAELFSFFAREVGNQGEGDMFGD